MINDHRTFRADWIPSGGKAQSGRGLGGISHTLEDLTHDKLVMIHSARLLSLSR